MFVVVSGFGAVFMIEPHDMNTAWAARAMRPTNNAVVRLEGFCENLSLCFGGPSGIVVSKFQKAVLAR